MTSGRVLRVLLVLVAAGLATGLALFVYPEPLRAAARDYLTLHRVKQHHEILRAAALESGVDVNLLAGIMVAESSGRVGVVSSAGALGLFQLSLVTARWRGEILGVELPEDDEDLRELLLRDAALNARLGANNMAWLLDTYDGDELRALCAYNAGARRLKELVDAEEGGWEDWRDRHTLAGDSAILAYGLRVLRKRDEFREMGLFEPAPADGAALAEDR